MWVGAVALVIGACALAKALADLDFLGENGEPGPGLFPELMAGALLVLGALLIVLQFQRGEIEEDDGSTTTDDRAKLTRAVVVWASLVVSIPIMVEGGFIIAMVLLVGFLILVIEKQRSWGSVAVVALLPVLAYALFSVLLEVPLPLGVFQS